LKKYLKSVGVMEQFERYLAQTYYKMAELIPKALQDWEMRQARGIRSLRLVLSTAAYTKSQIVSALDEGQEYLEMLCGPDGLVTRQDQEVGDLLVSVYSVTLQDRPDLGDSPPEDMRGSRRARERFNLTLYDQRTNEILDDYGVIVLYRVLYFNYGRELLRIRQNYSRSEWASKIAELRSRDPYTALDVEILARLDSIFLPEL